MKYPLQILQKLRSILIGMAVTLFVALPQASFANPEMKSIDEFFEAENKINPAHLQFAGLRCIALLSMVIENLDVNGHAELAQKIRAVHKEALNTVAISPSYNEIYADNQLKLMVAAYLERWQKALALTGSWGNDPIIRSEIQTCNQVFGNES